MRSYAHRNDPATVKLPRKHERRGKIKLAYLSSDFREHPISVLIARLIELHDRADFEVIGISFGIDDSPIRQRLIASFDRFHDARLQSDREVADLIASLEVDIVVDLNGRTDDARPGVLALRPAPIAVNFLGVAGNTGAEFLDYIIADRIVLPDAQQQFYSEKVVYLPDSYLVNDAGREISAHVPTRAEAGLPPDGFVFCAFNNSFKIQPAVFSRWLRLLARVEGSVLWLSRTNDVAIANLRGQAEAHGIDPARLIFAPRIPSSADHLARHRLAGLFVDTLPFNAHTTGADALWAGLPIVTCLGGTFPGRVAASMLHAVGLPELVTHSLDDYEALAIKLAEDPALLEQVRRKLEQNRRTCALFDNDRYRRHLEAAYRTMCEISWRGEAARGFGVKPDGSIAS
jgi:predicted O-linked N-acetylglucosamine transferase (SPINDLY family)